MFKLRPLFWPTLISLPIFVFALGLGVWQMERREWKRDILDRIAQNQAAAPMPFDELLKGDPLRREYGRVSLSGTFLHDREFHLAARSLKNDVGIRMSGQSARMGDTHATKHHVIAVAEAVNVEAEIG